MPGLLEKKKRSHVAPPHTTQRQIDAEADPRAHCVRHLPGVEHVGEAGALDADDQRGGVEAPQLLQKR